MIAHPSLGADEFDARVAGSAGHFNAVRIAECDVVVLDRVEKTAFPVSAFAVDFDWAGSFGVICPLGSVEQVSAPIANDSAGVIPDPTEIKMGAVLCVRREGSWAEPHFPIEVGGYRLWFWIAGESGLFGQDDLDLLKLADAAVPDEFRYTVVLRQRAILRAGLENAILFSHGIDEHLAFADGESWLFALDVFAGSSGHDAYQRVPMVRRGDHDGIDVFARDDFAEIFRHGAIFSVVRGIDEGFGLAHAEAIDVANDEDFGIVEFEIMVEIPVCAVLTAADETDGDFLAGSIRAQDFGRDEVREREGGGGGANEFASREAFHARKNSMREPREKEVCGLVQGDSPFSGGFMWFSLMNEVSGVGL